MMVIREVVKDEVGCMSPSKTKQSRNEACLTIQWLIPAHLTVFTIFIDQRLSTIVLCSHLLAEVLAQVPPHSLSDYLSPTQLEKRPQSLAVPAKTALMLF